MKKSETHSKGLKVNILEKFKKSKKAIFIVSLIILIIAGLITVININKPGEYPWGSNTFGHLYKGNILYDAFKEGNLFINFNSNWYNGVQTFRYGEPIVYYLLAIINLVTGDILKSFNVFLLINFIGGGLGFLCWGYYKDRQKLGLFLGILWFFAPNNLRVLFSEGNLPLALINAMLPTLILLFYKAQKENKKLNYLSLALIVLIMSLTQVTVTIMIVGAMIIYSLIKSVQNRKIHKSVILSGISLLGIFCSSFWTIPLITSGALKNNPIETAQLLDVKSSYLSQSLNPFLRFSNIELFYVGMSFIIVSVLGWLFTYKKKGEKTLFVAGIAIILCTDKFLIPVIKEIPFNNFIIISNITSLALVMIFIALLFWSGLRKSVLIVMCFFLSLDCMLSFEGLGHNREFPKELKSSIDMSSDLATQRIGVLDAAEYGAFPSYYISYCKSNTKKQMFGWAWKGAETSSNIVAINTALEGNFFTTMFDRSLELGTDTLIIKKSFIKDENLLELSANEVGYVKKYEDDNSIIYKYPFDEGFGTIPQYEGLAIGAYANNIIYNFPKFNVGTSDYIDDYKIEELQGYKAIFLTGFKYKNKSEAKRIIEELSRNGIKVVIDVTGMKEEEFMGITPKAINLKGDYGDFYYKNERYNISKFPNENEIFRCNYLSGGEEKQEESYTQIDSQVLNYIRQYNDNVSFIGLNIPYYATLTKDKTAIKVLEDAFTIKAGLPPDREVVRVSIDVENDKIIKISSDKPNVVTSLAAIDTFKSNSGTYERYDNLVKINDKEVVIEIGFPNMLPGIFISIISFISLLYLSILIKKYYKKKEVIISE